MNQLATQKSKTTKKNAAPAKRASSSQAKRPAGRQGKAGNSAQRGQGKTTAAERAQKALRLEAQMKARHQAIAVVLFALSLLLFALIFIPGESVWFWTHSQILGLFGVCAILWPILLIYIAVVTALEKPRNKVSVKIWLMVAIIVLFCAASYIFQPGEFVSGLSYGERLSALYWEGVDRVGSGLFGGLLGVPMVAALGGVGAKIFIVLLLFVAIMILTGTSLIQLFKAVTKPMDIVSDKLEGRNMRRQQEQEVIRRGGNIDVPLDPLDDGLPAHPVRVNNPNAIPERNEKLERLEKAFSVPAPELPPEKKKPATEAQTKQPEKTGPEEGTAEAAAAAFVAKRRAAQQKSDPAQKQPDPQSVPVQLSIYPDEPVRDGSYQYPPISLLQPSKEPDEGDITAELQTSGQMLVDTLKSFGVQTRIVDISRGPAVTRYELQPAAGVKISKITNLADDIALNLAASGVRIEAPIPGKAAVGIEVPNQKVSIVKMRELIDSNSFALAKSRLTVTLGRDIAGNVTLADLAKMPHVLIAGSTGSGKSVCINSLIISLLYKSTPDEVRFLMVDPKVVELGIYNGIPHLLVPVVTDPRKAAGALGWAVNEMLNRYKIFAEYNVRDLEAYNRMVDARRQEPEEAKEGEASPELRRMPQIVIIIDELADLMMAAPNEVEDSICRLAQMARAAGMHLVIATQRPSVDVITGIIKANIPSRIAFAVSSQVDSRTILDMGGAEKLLGRGDMLFSPVGSPKPIRVQGCFVTDAEIEAVVAFVKKAHESGYDEGIIEEIEKNAVSEKDKSSGGDESGEADPMLEEAIKCVVEAGQASTSLLQRRLRLGYARAGRLIDDMEQMGVVGPHEGSKPRQVLITYQQWLERNMQHGDE